MRTWPGLCRWRHNAWSISRALTGAPSAAELFGFKVPLVVAAGRSTLQHLRGGLVFVSLCVGCCVSKHTGWCYPTQQHSWGMLLPVPDACVRVLSGPRGCRHPPSLSRTAVVCVRVCVCLLNMCAWTDVLPPFGAACVWSCGQWRGSASENATAPTFRVCVHACATWQVRRHSAMATPRGELCAVDMLLCQLPVPCALCGRAAALVGVLRATFDAPC
jgi:hypothetical protein